VDIRYLNLGHYFSPHTPIMPETLLWHYPLAWDAHIDTSEPSYSTGWTYRSGPVEPRAIPAPTPPTMVLQSLLSGDPPLREWDHFHCHFSYRRHSLGKDLTILQFWMKSHSTMPLSPWLPHAGPGAPKHAIALPENHGGR